MRSTLYKEKMHWLSLHFLLLRDKKIPPSQPVSGQARIGGCLGGGCLVFAGEHYSRHATVMLTDNPHLVVILSVGS